MSSQTNNRATQRTSLRASLNEGEIVLKSTDQRSKCFFLYTAKTITMDVDAIDLCITRPPEIITSILR